uniref:BTB domain-containing protein n=1 Tax=Romanomermis culicivorax TaxID=13658 RepID=A0A915I8E0_ROMCU
MQIFFKRLLNDQENVDLILKTDDGSKIGAHSCILKSRCPTFFDRYIKNQLINDQLSPNQSIILISDVNFDSLKFYLKCIYAEDQIPSLVLGGAGAENSNFKAEN